MINYQKTWATLDIDEKMAFRDMTIKAVQEIYPHYIVRPMEPTEADCFFVGNKQENVRIQVPLRDLYIRFSATGRSRSDLKDTIFEVYAPTLNRADDYTVAIEVPEFTWSDVRDYAKPQHVRTLEVHDTLGHIYYPLGAEVVTALAMERPQDDVAYFITREMLTGWDKSEEELFKEAMDNLSDLAQNMAFVGSKTPRTELWNEMGTGFASTCIMLGGVRRLIADTMGVPSFRFGIPSRHRLFCWGDITDENYQREMKARMEREMAQMPYPLTSMIYEVGANGEMSIVKPQPVVPPVPLVSNN
jgi:hypothetical protein